MDAQWVAIIIAFLGLALTNLLQILSIRQVQHQVEIMRQDKLIQQRERFHDVWSRLDELLIEHPELSDLWLTAESLEKIRAKNPTTESLIGFLRRRALAAFIMGTYFRNFKLSKEIRESLGGVEDPSWELDIPELRSMWEEGALREDFAHFPEFIEHVEARWFKKASKKT